MSRAPVVISLAFLAAAGASGCSSNDESSSTAGKRIVLHTTIGGDAATRTKLTTGFGWDVTLSKAVIATSGIYYFDGPPPTALFTPGKRKTPFDRFASLFVGTAYAHPGHYQAGTALGEVLLAAPVAVDLLAPPAALPDGDGITGIYRSARFVIAAAAPANATLNGHIAVAEGVATKHDGSSPAPIYFRLVADFADIQSSINNGAVDGCVLDETTVTDSGSIAAEVRPAVWLNLVDFAPLAPGSAAAPTEAKNAGFSQGVTLLSAYHFTYAK
ncbi:MAG: hypothetical protein JWP97_6563 [Labilithrix sp.]|nr:hypothetical protein [Labilithrix sp.]